MTAPQTPPFKIHHGDCLAVLRAMPDNSVDSVCTDPPYGLSQYKPNEVIECLKAWLAGEVYQPKGTGFMGNAWDAWVPGPEIWRECLRVLKPGGHVVAFAGTRSMDLMCMSIRLAGFELRDSIGYAHSGEAQEDIDGQGAPLLAWAYATGFPKSQNVAKAIDKAGGGVSTHLQHRVEFAQEIKSKRELAGVSRAELAAWFPEYAAVTANWERVDVGFRVPTEVAYTKLIERLGVRDGWRDLVRAEDLRRIVSEGGTDRRGDETVYGLAHSGVEYAATSDAAKQWDGWGSCLKPAWEPIILARKPLIGTLAKNVLEHGTGGLNIDGCRVDCAGSESGALGRFPANLIHDNSSSVVSLFPQSKGQSGDLKETGRASISKNTFGDMPAHGNYAARNDTGSAARFFYSGKASSQDRHEGLEHPGTQFKHGATLRQIENKAQDRKGNHHQTVKPTAVMTWLVRLVTPPGGVVLDPFCGSGSTGKAAVLEGFRFIGVERELDFVHIARARVSWAWDKVKDAMRQSDFFKDAA